MAERDTYDMLDSISYYDDGEVIFVEESRGDEMYVIQSGEVELSQMINNEKRVLTILGKDSFFGEMALLSHRPRTATATAIGRTALLPFDREAMLKRIETNPRFALTLLNALSERLAETTSKLVAMMERNRDEQT